MYTACPPAVLQVRLRGLGITFFILCVVIYTFGAWGLVQPLHGHAEQGLGGVEGFGDVCGARYTCFTARA